MALMVGGSLVAADGLDSLLPFWIEDAQGARRCFCVTRHHPGRFRFGSYGRRAKSVGPRISRKLLDFW